ncbi:PAS domain S-box protein, partial [Chloroflexota bacterium]
MPGNDFGNDTAKRFPHVDSSKDRSISQGLTIGLMITVLLVSTIAIGISYFAASQRAKAQLEAKADEYIIALTDILEVPLWNVAEQTIGHIGASYAQNEFVAGLKITDNWGTVYFDMGEKENVPLASRTSEVFYQGRPVGHIEISLTSNYFAEISRQLLWSSVFIILINLFSVIIMTRFLSRLFLREPISQLGEIVDSYAAGQYDSPKYHTPYIEFRPLVTVLDEMAGSLQRYSEGLESLVKQRTAELQIAVEQLEREISERVQAEEGQREALAEALQATQALQESEERYRTLFERMHGGFALHEIVCDEQGQPCDYRFLDVNPAFEAMTGLTHEQVLGKTVLQVLPDTEEYWIRTYGDVALTGESVRFENYARELNKYFEVTAYRPQHGQFATIFVDITERKRAEKALQESEKLLRTITVNYPSYLSIIEKDLTIGFTSGRELAKLNLDPDGFVGLTLEEVFGEQVLTVRDNYLKAFAGEEVSFELYINDQYQLYNPIPLPDENGEISRILVVVDNITERKKAEEALRESEEKFRSLAENSQDYIMRYDRQYRHLYENPAALRVAGFTGEDIIGKTHREAGFEEEQSDFWEKRITQVFETGEPSQSTFGWDGIEGKVYLDWRL